MASLIIEKNRIDTEYHLKASSYLDESLKYGIKPGLERIEVLLKEMSNPYLNYSTILITGTNGKTSTARMISAILNACGIKTGLYISPHLYSYCERISFGNNSIGKKEFYNLVEEVKPLIDKTNKITGDNLTNFEILTALAFYYFALKNADCAVLEVGMGARFDATCLTKAKVSVITNVELDHTDYLGSSIKQIAKEKAFVIKKGTKVVVGYLKKEAMEVIKKEASEKKASISYLGKNFFLESLTAEKDYSQKITIKGIFDSYNEVNINSPGLNQAHNAAIAITAAELYDNGPLSNKKLSLAFGELHFDGRLEILQKDPVILVDGAHNPAAASGLRKVLEEEFSYENLIFVLAIYKDKDYKSIIKELAPIAKEIIFSENSSHRSLKASTLNQVFKGKKFKIIKPIAKAIKVAKEMASHKDLICITGSLGTVADARKILATRR